MAGAADPVPGVSRSPARAGVQGSYEHRSEAPDHGARRPRAEQVQVQVQVRGGSRVSLSYTIPPRLRPGDVVRVVAPCGPFERKRFDAGIGWLREAGLVPAHDQGIFARSGYLAGDDARRLAELEAALADRAARAIWVARGGYGAMRLLGQLEPRAVATAPRWLVGFSDVTALHALWQRAGLASVHAANLASLEDWRAPACEALRGLLFDGTAVSLSGRPVAGKGVARGPLVGGNLALLAGLAGTGCLPDLQGAIVLVEEVREAPYRIDRMLTQLELAGVLAGAAGFAIGQLSDCDPPRGEPEAPGALEVVTERLARLGVPVLAELPLGHHRTSMAVPLGVEATLDCAAGTLLTRDFAQR
jgi:muramoyltetrapeptide carboxypeptidase